MGKIFGTDGVRGIANTELTPDLAYCLGKAGAYVLGKTVENPLVLIAKDTRISGDMLEDAISAGILSMGGNVIKAGVLPTPAVAYLVKEYNATAGIVISASHNPFEYNGIKFFNDQGFKLDDSLEEEIEEIILSKRDISSHIIGDKLGHVMIADSNAENKYIEFLKNTMTTDLKGINLVIDCANGAAYRVAERVFAELGARVTAIHNTPDGININEKCGSTHPAKLQAAVVAQGADLGLAFDGDADRLIAVDEKGNVIDGDRTIYICMKMLKDEGSLVNDSVVVTVMSNIGFHKKAAELGCKVEVSQVGDRYVLEKMLKTGCIIGGEQSGHMIFLNHTTTGDGILSALQLLKAYKKSGKKLSELAAEVTIYPQILINAKILNKNKKKYMDDPVIQAAIEATEKAMEGDGRVLIRPSGTEPLVRVMLEGSDLEKIEPLAQSLATLISARMGR